MSTQIDFRTLPANVPVLCIPRVYQNISESRIRKIFDDLNMGILERIDIVSKYSAKPGAVPSDKGEKFNRVFVHFRRWNDTENSRVARERLLNGKEIKIIYDDPWFWKISAYRETERKQCAEQPRKATLQFDSDEERPSGSSNYRPRHSDDRPRHSDERPRHTDDRTRHTDDRTRHPYDRPRHPVLSRERRDDNKPRHREDSRERRPQQRQEYKPVTKMAEPRTPSCSPPKERPLQNQSDKINEGSKIDYGDITIPFIKKRNFVAPTKKPLKIEDNKEEGLDEKNV